MSSSVPPQSILNDQPVGNAPISGPLIQGVAPKTQPIQRPSTKSRAFLFNDPGSSANRLDNLVRGIQYKLESDDGISEVESRGQAIDLVKKAMSEDSGYTEHIKNYIKHGAWNDTELGFLVTPKTPIISNEQMRFNASKEALAKRSTFTAAMQDYILEPLSGLATSAVQGTFIDPVIGIANLVSMPFGGSVEPWNLKENMRALSKVQWAEKGSFSDKFNQSLKQQEAFSKAQNELYEQKTSAKVVRNVAEFIGSAAPFLLGAGEATAAIKGTAAAAKVASSAGRIEKAFNAVKAAAPSRALFKAGEYGGDALVSKSVWLSGKLAQNPKFLNTLARQTGAFATYSALVAKHESDPAQAANLSDIKAGFVHGAVTGPLMMFFGMLARGAYSKILTGGLKESKAAQQAMSNWSRENGINKLSAETDQQFFNRVFSSWMEAGNQGFNISGRRLAAITAQSSIESFGLNSIDPHFWSEGYEYIHDGDANASARFVEKLVTGAIGLSVINGYRLADNPRFKRNQVNPLGQNAPGQENIKVPEGFPRTELPIQPGYKVDEMGVPIAPPEQIPGVSGDIYTSQAKPTEYIPGKYDVETGTYFPNSNIDLSQSGMHGNDLARHGFQVKEKKEPVVFNKDDTRREQFKTLSSNLEGEATVNINGHTAENLLKLGIPKDSPAGKALQEAIDNGSADVTLSAKELKNVIDYHTRRAPKQRGNEGVQVAQPKIQSVDVAVEKYLQAFGVDTKPIRAQPVANESLVSAKPETLGEPSTSEVPAEATYRTGASQEPAKEINVEPQQVQSETIEIPNSPHYIELSEGKAKLSPYLSEVLGAPREIDIKDLSIVNKSLLVSALRSKTLLPGIEIDTNGTKADGNTHKVIRFNEVLENDGTVFGEWKPSESKFKIRPKDEIDDIQKQHVIDLLDIKSSRGDLKKEDQHLLGTIIETLDSVAAHKDPSVKETMDVLPLLMDAIENAPPQHASIAIDTVAKLLTNSGPNVALKEYSESLQILRNNEIMDRQQASLEELSKQPEAQLQSAEKEVAAKIEEVQLAEAAQLRSQVEAEMRGEEPKPQQPVDLTAVEQAQQKVEAKKRKSKKKDLPPVDPKRLNESGFLNISLPPEIEKLIIRATDPIVKGIKSAVRWVGDDFIKKASRSFSDVGENQISESVRTKGYKTVSDAKKYKDEANAAGGYVVRSFKQQDLQEAHQFVSSPSGQSRTTKWFAGGDEHAGIYYGVSRAALNPETQRLLDSTHNVSLKFAEIANNIGLSWKNGNGQTGIAPNKDIWRLPYELTPLGVDMIRTQTGPVWESYVAAMKELHPSVTEQSLRTDINDMMSMGNYDNTEFLRKYKVLPTEVRDLNNKNVYHTIFYDTPKAWNDRIIDSSSQVLAARANFHDVHELVGAQAAPKNRDVIAELAQGQPVPAAGFIEELAMKYGKGHEVVKNAINFMRTVHGMSPELNYGSDIIPGTESYAAVKAISGLYKVSTADKLSTAGIGNLTEPIAHAQQLGLSNVLSSYKDVLKSVKDGTFASIAENLARDGFITDKEMFKDYSYLQTGDQRAQYLSNKASEIFMSPFEVAQSFAEVVLGDAARKRLDSMMAGQGTAGDRMMLSKIGFNRAEAEAMTSGRGTPEQYDIYKRLTVQSLTASSMHPALRSQFMSSKNVNLMLRFVKYFANQTSFLINESSNMREAFEAKDYTRAKEHTFNILSMAAKNVAAGILSKELTELVFHGASGVMADFRKFLQNPGEYLAATWARGMFGGAGQVIGSTAKDLTEEDKTTSQIAGEAISRIIGPVGEVNNFLDFALTRGPEYNSSRSLFESIGMYLEKQIPASKGLREGLFGIGAIALGSKDVDMERTRKQYASWAKDNDESHFISGGGDESTYEMMKATKDLMSTNKDKFINAHRHAMQSIILKFKNGDMSMEEASQAARQSLLNKRWIGGKKYSADNPDPTPEDLKKMQSLRDRLGPDYKYALIHDKLLETMADIIHTPND